MSTTPESTTGSVQDDAVQEVASETEQAGHEIEPAQDEASTVDVAVEEVPDGADEQHEPAETSADDEPEVSPGAGVAEEGDGADADSEGDADADAHSEGDPDADAVSAAPTRGRDARTEDLVREGEIAADFLEGLLDIADLSGDLEVDIEGNRAAVAIVDSEDGVAPRRLVGPGGSVLDALQELTRLAVQADTGERSRLMLDVAGYRSDRRAALVKTAREAIAEVRESGQRRELEPMTAFERKVVHDEVLAGGLHSESEGTEPSRYVVILPSE